MTRHTYEGQRDFVEDNGGVHLMHLEHTLCGLAFDAFGSGDAVSELRPSKKKTISCQICADVVVLCRGVRVADREDLVSEEC